MKILIVAASKMELEGLKKSIKKSIHQLDFFVHEVGIFSSTIHLSTIDFKKYDFCIQLGIAGSYSKKIKLGDVLWVKEEKLGDFGAENNNEMLDIFELGLADKHIKSKNKCLINPIKNNFLEQLIPANSITVNLCAGKKSTITLRKEKFNTTIENMEGYVFHYFCLKNKLPFVQFRSISNYIEIRNKANWQISLAIKNLHQTVIAFINSLEK